MKKLIESFDLSKINNNNKNSEIFIDIQILIK